MIKHDVRKQKLMELGSAALSDILLDLATNIEQVDDRINLVVGPALDTIKRVRRKMAVIANNTTFIGYSQIHSFAGQLEQILEDLEFGVTDPCIGLDLVAEFFETDSSVFNTTDDDGIIGDVYLGPAKELFVKFASSCQDKEKIVSLLIHLYINDNYGARESLLHNITDSFDTSVIALLQKKLKTLIANEHEDKKKKAYTSLLRSITEQGRDAKLFEDALQGKQVELSSSAILKVSQTLLERDEVEAAHAWIGKISHDNISYSYEVEKILKEIYARQGDSESLIALHYRNFKTLRTLSTFQELLKITGEEKREEILAQELALICENQRFDADNAQFLADVGMIDELEAYVFARVEKLDGGDYYSLPEVAEALVEHARYLAASLIYRCLLESMMERAYAKSYHHGVDYLRAMDTFSPLIKDWKNYPTHNAFKVRLLQENKRKTSFWNQYVTK